MLDTVEIEVECTGRFRKGTKPIFDRINDQWLTGEGDKIENFKVWLEIFDGDKESAIDITKTISSAEYDRLYQNFLEDMRADERT